MIFEPVGYGTCRYEAATATKGEPDALLFLTTMWKEDDDVRKLTQAVLDAYTCLWDKKPLLRVQINSDAPLESATLVVTRQGEIKTEGEFAQKSLEMYRHIYNTYKFPELQPPMCHDVCFLSTGHTVHYKGVD